LCKKLLERNDLFLPGGNNAIEARRNAVMTAFSNGKIKDRYYGIFIDEVQMFEPSWYKFSYNLLENKENGDHIFVICGDKTQEIKQRQKHGKAPWNAGEGYPMYRGGNKSIRIEKNFRNCVEINDYINRYVQYARALIKMYSPEEQFDPDMFLRGQAFRHGEGVTIKQFKGNAVIEAEKVVESVITIHDEKGVPYDEIAIAMYFTKYKPLKYYLESALLTAFDREHIPYNRLYKNDQSWGGRYGDGGVSFITFDSVLGLDFQAVVVCGVKPLGAYDKTKQLKSDSVLEEEQTENLKKNISYLYVACTRAKDYLHIVLGESSRQSIYNKLLTDSEE
jgi:superfamily I DNA/RNA helicase